MNNNRKLTPCDSKILLSLQRRFQYFKKRMKLAPDGSFYCADEHFAYEESVSRSTLIRSKRRLRDDGYINFQSGSYKGNATKYWLLEKGIKMKPFRRYERTPNCLIKDSNLTVNGYQNDTTNIVNNSEKTLPEISQEEIKNLKDLGWTNQKIKDHFITTRGHPEFEIDQALGKYF